MTLWVGNGAVPKSSSQWPELFNFQNSFNCHCLELLRTALLPIHKVMIIAVLRWYEWYLLVFCKQTPL